MRARAPRELALPHRMTAPAHLTGALDLVEHCDCIAPAIGPVSEFDKNLIRSRGAKCGTGREADRAV